MRKLNIAIIMQSPDIGGAETYLLSLIDQFKKGGSSVLLVTNKGKFYDYADSFNVNLKPLPFILDIMGDYRGLIKTILLFPFAVISYSRLLWKLKNQKTDIIFLSGFTEKLLVTFLSIFFRIPVAWIEYGPLKTVFKRNFYFPKLIYIAIAPFSKKIIVPSKNTYKSLKRDAFIRDSRLILIPCGVEIKSKTRVTVPENLQEKFIIGSVSRLTREKGQEYLIRAIPRVLEKIPNAYFIIVGDGPDKDYFQNLIKELGVHKSVVMPGFVSNIDFYYSIFDIFVFSTIWDLEGFGLVIPEAMKYKIPVIGSDMGPVPEIIDDNINGIIVEQKNEKEIAEAIIKLGLDENLRIKMGENGYKKAVSIYNIEKISSQIMDVFYDAIS